MTCRAESLLEAAPVAFGELLIGLAAAISDPRGELGAAALAECFGDELKQTAGSLGLTLPGADAVADGQSSFARREGTGDSREDLAEVEFVRLFVNGRHGPACPPWASYYTEGRLAGEAALRARSAAGPGLMGALKLEEADAAVTEFVSLALLLLAGERDAAGSYLREHLEPWAGAFAARLADQALLSQHRLAAEVLLALFGAAEVRHEAVVS